MVPELLASFSSSLIAPALSQLHENAPAAPKTEEKPAETDFNTMVPQIGTVVFQNESEPVRQAEPPSEKAKNAQMNQFISDVALNYAMQNPNLAENKETYIGRDENALLDRFPSQKTPITAIFEKKSQKNKQVASKILESAENLVKVARQLLSDSLF